MDFRIFIRTALCLLLISAAVDMSAANSESKTEYVEKKQVRRNGNDVTVLTLSMEWPMKIKGQCFVGLQRELCQKLFGNHGQTMYEGLDSLYQRLGTEIEGIPEEEGVRIHYRSIVLRLLSWEPGRFLSLYYVITARDKDKSTCSEIKQKLFTYDIAHDSFLFTKDIIKYRCMPYYSEHDFFLDAIQFYMPKVKYVVEGDSVPNCVALLAHKQGVVLNLRGSNGLDDIDDLMVMPFVSARSFLKNQVLDLMLREVSVSKKKSKQMQQASMRLDSIINVQSAQPDVYLVAETMPEFQGGTSELADYLSRNLKYPEDMAPTNLEGKVVVSFVVNEDGQVESPSVIHPLSPVFDREAVRVVMAMPRWVPGRMKGVPVKVRMQLPVRFKLQREI